MATDASLGDILAGAAGRPVNRVALNSAVQQGQAMAGLRTAQTEDALMKASEMRDQQGANDRLEGSLYDVLTATGDAHAREHARYGRDVMVGGHGDALKAEQAFGDILKNINTQTIMNPGADPNARLAADQANNPTTNPYQAVEGQLVPRFAPGSQTGGAQVIQTPASEAKSGEQNALAHLHNAQADAGGFNPHTGALAGLGPDESAALDKAVSEGRLDPSRLNSRTAPILAGIEMRNPGQVNFNRLSADAALQRNPTFQQKAMNMEALPTVMTHMTTLGKKIGYSDIKVVGEMEKWFRGQANDPKLSEYMTVRNDVLMNIANVMRGVGMSDKAHEAEIEAASPTKSPLALDAWLKGQMAALQPRLDQQRRVTHLGEKPQGGTPKPGETPSEAGAPAAAPNGLDPSDPFGLRGGQ